ncbi:MAG: GFA family protein [Devosia sp.]
MGLPEFPVEGGCQCGAIRYRLKAAPLAIYACHCKDCQRFSGTSHSLSMLVRKGDAELIAGVFSGFDKAADSGRMVRMLGCSDCGTKIWNEPLASPELRVVKPGTLDDSSWAEPIGNIWTARKLPWVEIDPDVPNFAGQPVSRQPLIDAFAAARLGAGAQKTPS